MALGLTIRLVAVSFCTQILHLFSSNEMIYHTVCHYSHHKISESPRYAEDVQMVTDENSTTEGNKDHYIFSGIPTQGARDRCGTVIEDFSSGMKRTRNWMPGSTTGEGNACLSRRS